MKDDVTQLTFNAVAHISMSKVLQKEAPLHVMRLDILERMKEYPPDEVMEALRGLVRSGKVAYGETINDYYFKISTPESR